MPNIRTLALRATLGLALAFLPAAAARAQSLERALAELVARPAVSGYEQEAAKSIAARLEKFKPQRDNLGNVRLTLGSGAPHRLIVASLDEPGYVVSGVTSDGYLRVQRLPQAAPHALFDQLHAAQPVVIHTRAGQWVYGVVAGLSTHLQTARRDPPRGSHPDEMYVDIGAASAGEVRRAGVDLLDPMGLDRELLLMAGGFATAPGIGDRFGAAVLLELAARAAAAKFSGTLTLAFVTQQWTGGRGLDRLLQQIQPDEVVLVGRFRRAGGGPGAGGAAQQQRRPAREPSSGALIAVSAAGAAPEGLAGELQALAEKWKIPHATDFSAPVTRAGGAQGSPLPQRSAQVGVSVAWTSTPAEMLSLADAENLLALLEAYVTGIAPASAAAAPSAPPLAASRRKEPPEIGAAGPDAEQILSRLVETYGMSEYESEVREEITRLLPPWAKTETDDSGNLILRWRASGQAGKQAPHIAFVAHMDEIGYRVQRIAENGRLEVQSRGGGIIEFFSGHAMLAHSATGARAGVMELPEGWDQPNFQWPRGGAAAAAEGPPRALRVDVGARSAAEAERLGFKAGDWVTVPKKYRKLYARRANGRSFDDRVGSAALVAAAWALGASLPGRNVTFLWSTGEEIGLVGARGAAERLAKAGDAPTFVFAVDTFVSSDSPLESPRFANAPIGKGFVIRAVDGSNITARSHVDRLVRLARAAQVPVQYGVTGGGNDGSVFLRYGTVDVPISWPLRYSHSPGEVIDLRDYEALARIVAVISRQW
jgi:putative aminopeptidase FrvX